MDSVEIKLDEADRQAAMSDVRLSHETVFGNARRAGEGRTLRQWKNKDNLPYSPMRT